ncbi:MAG: hypothetical protein ACLP0J_29820 [Solirubrobacteraceae bacterium]
MKSQPLADRSREAYLAQAREFVTWLAGSEHGGRALADPHVRDWAVRDYKAADPRRARQGDITSFSCALPRKAAMRRGRAP